MLSFQKNLQEDQTWRQSSIHQFLNKPLQLKCDMTSYFDREDDKKFDFIANRRKMSKDLYGRLKELFRLKGADGPSFPGLITTAVCVIGFFPCVISPLLDHFPLSLSSPLVISSCILWSAGDLGSRAILGRDWISL